MEDKIKLQKEFARFAESLIGMSDDVLRDVSRYGISIRITKHNGDACMSTCDFRMDRINVEIENGKITNAYVG